MGKHEGLSGGGGSEGKVWTRGFTVVSMREEQEGRVSRLRAG